VDSKGAAADQSLTADIFDAGAYWRATVGGFSANARLAGDYLSIGSHRVVDGVGADGAPVSRTAKASWSGYDVNGRLMASYEAHLGRYFLRPQASLDYIRLQEGAYTEQEGGDSVDLSVASRTSSSGSAFAGVALGALFQGDLTQWGPEVLVGYRDVATEQIDPTRAHFVSGATDFSLDANRVGGQGAVARLALKGENGSGGFSAEAGAEQRDALTIYDLRLTAHFTF
jgi:hypothetical protein